VSGKLIDIDLKFGKGILNPYSGLVFEDKHIHKLINRYCLFDLDDIILIHETSKQSIENYNKKANERIEEMEKEEKHRLDKK
jgi:hypothetical protein